MITYAVFLLIGEISVRRTEQTAQILIVLRVLIGITYDESDGTARRFAFKDTAEQFDLVSLLTAGGDAALSWATTVEFLLYEVEIDVDASRHTVDDASYGSTVTLAKGGQCE